MVAMLALVAKLMLSGDGSDVCSVYYAEANKAGERGDCVQNTDEDVICDPHAQTVLRTLFKACHAADYHE